MTKNLDPTTISIIARGLHAVTEEMGINLIRSAFSTVVREARDCSTALLGPDGNIVAQAEMIPMQTAALSMSFKAARDKLGLSGVGPGEAIIMNDPYHGGQHLNDIILFTPIFLDDDLLGWAGSTAHHLDIGGGSAGVNTKATDLIQEGLVLPPILFDVERDWNGGVVETVLAANIRMPDIGIGDMNAQFAANHTGARRVRELAGKYGAEGLWQAMAEVQDYSERRMRAGIEDIADGAYQGEAFIDEDVFDPNPVRIAVEVKVEGSDIWMDFAGTDPQLKSMFNCPLSSAHAAAFAAVRCIIQDKDIPANDGCNRPLHLTFPRGSVLNPNPPAPVRARMTSAYRAFDAIHMALSKAAPERVPAQGYNCTTAFYISQQRKDGTFRVLADILGGGYGAGHDYDGADGVDCILSNCSNTPVESIEQVHPHLRLKSYTLLTDTGGAGKWRGGMGFCREVEILEEDVFVNLYSDHFKFAPQGVHKGQPGCTGALTVNRAGQIIELGSNADFDLMPGDVVKLRVGGGGGYGDPRERPRESVERDILDGRISLRHAAENYGYSAAAEAD
jgi:N-methylhydantoinase B